MPNNSLGALSASVMKSMMRKKSPNRTPMKTNKLRSVAARSSMNATKARLAAANNAVRNFKKMVRAYANNKATNAQVNEARTKARMAINAIAPRR